MSNDKKSKRGPVQPRPAYIVYEIKDGALVVHGASRRADDVLQLQSDNPGSLYHRFEMK